MSLFAPEWVQVMKPVKIKKSPAGEIALIRVFGNIAEIMIRHKESNLLVEELAHVIKNGAEMYYLANQQMFLIKPQEDK